MAMSQKERTQVLGLLIALGVGAPVAFWVYWRTPKAEELQRMEFQIDSLNARIDTARAALAEGTLESLRATVSQYERALSVMREWVPVDHEVLSLIDSVASRAQRRGVELVSIDSLPDEIEPPFRVKRNQVTVLGPYDEVGEFLSDVASLRRIMVPYGVSMEVATTTDLQGLLVEQGRTYLKTTFNIKTFVKGSADVFAEGLNGTS
jgi:type IV pilus assembly protein PilO